VRRRIWAARWWADRLCRRVYAIVCAQSPKPTSNRGFSSVANIKSQIKRIKQNETRRLRNKSVKTSLKTAIRQFREAADGGEVEKAQELARRAGQKLDVAVSKGVIHANQAANKKSAIFKRAASL
jgi:small subunit ribosomal protein S20